jgi:cold shock CspA family protein
VDFRLSPSTAWTPAQRIPTRRAGPAANQSKAGWAARIALAAIFKVKFFNEQKGFGFIVPDDGGSDVYIHASALRRSGVSRLEPEQRVRFATRQGMKGVEVDRIEAI